MSVVLVFVLAMVAMCGLAATRIARVRSGRTQLPEMGAKVLLVLALVVVPPIVLSLLVDPAAGLMGGAASIPLYALALAALAFAMSLVAQGVGLVAPAGLAWLVRIGLVGDDGGWAFVPFDPPITARLAKSVAEVASANVAFPRGPEFPAQVDRPGFRSAWDALDAATGRLEGSIAEDVRLGLGVAGTAKATAVDARSRLDTLRHLATVRGQAWAAA